MKQSKIDRNIIRYQGKITSYTVVLQRRNQSISETYLTLSDAINARDEIEKVWQNERRLKHSSIFQPELLRQAKKRLRQAKRYYSDEEIEIEHYQGKIRRVVKCECSKCSKIVRIKRAATYRAFVDRGRICKSCIYSKSNDKRVNARNERSRAYSTNRSTKIKNITYDRRHDRYIITISRDKSTFLSTAKSLDDAIRMKERALKLYEEFGNLPTRKVLQAMLKVFED